EKETLTFEYTGDTVVGIPSTPNLAAQATEEADGSAGDLSLADARFDLTPTLGSTPASYVTGVSGAGVASAPATGLGVDLWTVGISVPASNQFWTGANPAAAELALSDGARQLKGNGKGTDSASMDVTAKFLNVRFGDGAWSQETRLEPALNQFQGATYDWVVVLGSKAIAQVHGTAGALPAVLRIQLEDLGSPGHSGDTFRGVIRDGVGTVMYDSGLVMVTNGNLRVE
ncbi:MAG: hypothetical protein ACRDH9_01200, partial [Actinomycetota bacterium]